MNIQDIVQLENVNIIDVRETYEFEMGHIPDSLNMPLSSFMNFVDNIRKMEGPKVFYCRSGNRSGQAVSFLKENGITDVYNGGSLTMMENFLIPS